MAIRCVYTDLDGTLLGRAASLFRDADGAFTLLPARGLEACHRAGAAVYVWTVNDAALANALAESSIDGIITDDPRIFPRGMTTS